MKVKLPEASAAVIDRPLETITLEIKRGEPGATQPESLMVRWWEEGITGELFWPPKEDEDPDIGLSLLRLKLQEHKARLEEDSEPSVVIAAEDSVPYQIVITVIDMCEQMELSDIVLAIQRKSAEVVD
jgi:hypothetical protein